LIWIIVHHGISLLTPDHFSEVSVLDLLGDDGRNSISDGRPVPEAHVAFSVEGNGLKVDSYICFC